ncbi:MAG: pyridoxal-phosphate dependent enzyme, partial [Oscillospiraceae bacterium]
MAQFVCTSCQKTVALSHPAFRCECGGLYELDFTAPTFDLSLVDQSQWNIFRYRAFMPLHNELWRDVTLGEGMTATLELSPGLWCKLDYAMPTLSFKDRGAAALIWLCKTIGVEKVLQDSSGNAGNAVAAYCARAGIACEIYVPAGTSPKKIAMIRSHGAAVTVFDGTRDETADACRAKARNEGLYYASHVYNPMFYQGTKTYLYEVFEQLGRIPDFLFVPTGNGTLLLGCQKALTELYAAGAIGRLPKIFLVQSERCAPLFGTQKIPRDIAVQPTLAEGIAIGKPMRGPQIFGGGYAGEQEVILAPEAGILP